MRLPRSIASVVTTIGLVVQATGLAQAAEGADEQPVVVSPTQAPVPPARTGEAAILTPVAPPPATALVHVDAEPGVVLKWNTYTGLSGMGQCPAPCDAALPLQASYFLTGEDVRNSPPFHLEASAGQRVVVHASTASRTGFNVGIAVLSVGGAGIVAGTTMLLLGAMGIGNCTDSEGFIVLPECRANSGLEIAGGAVALGGVAVALIGVVVLVSNRHTDVTQNVLAFLSPPPKGTNTALTGVGLGAERVSWATARPIQLPILSRRF
jgi:hypothetical protein